MRSGSAQVSSVTLFVQESLVLHIPAMLFCSLAKYFGEERRLTDDTADNNPLDHSALQPPTLLLGKLMVIPKLAVVQEAARMPLPCSSVHPAADIPCTALLQVYYT